MPRLELLCVELYSKRKRARPATGVTGKLSVDQPGPAAPLTVPMVRLKFPLASSWKTRRVPKFGALRSNPKLRVEALLASYEQVSRR